MHTSYRENLLFSIYQEKIKKIVYVRRSRWWALVFSKFSEGTNQTTFIYLVSILLKVLFGNVSISHSQN
jgi:hypothetical protein